LPKKIKFDLLLTDLALQFGYARARRLKLRARGLRPCAAHSQTSRFSLGRPTATA